MPVQPRVVALDTAGAHEIVKSGQRINGLSISRVPRGVFFYVQFGNNPPVGPWAVPVTFTFGAGVALADVREGVWIVTLAPAVGASLDLFVSFT